MWILNPEIYFQLTNMSVLYYLSFCGNNVSIKLIFVLDNTVTCTLKKILW